MRWNVRSTLVASFGRSYCTYRVFRVCVGVHLFIALDTVGAIPLLRCLPQHFYATVTSIVVHFVFADLDNLTQSGTFWTLIALHCYVKQLELFHVSNTHEHANLFKC